MEERPKFWSGKRNFRWPRFLAAEESPAENLKPDQRDELELLVKTGNGDLVKTAPSDRKVLDVSCAGTTECQTQRVDEF
mgnify:CR=1 FL=1